MALIRILSACTELTAAYLMTRYNRVDAALRINGLLGMVGPLVLIVTTGLGLAGMVTKISPFKTLLVMAGVGLIVLGSR